MIVDIILDRKDGFGYNAHDFYMYCMRESSVFNGIGDNITRALDGGTEEDVKQALCQYIDENGYNPLIKDYINRINWIGHTDPQVELDAAQDFNNACNARAESAIKFDERQDDGEGTVTLFFIAPKELLTREYPEAEFAEISIELPGDDMRPERGIVSVSPVCYDADGNLDYYDWVDVSLPHDEIASLISLAEQQLNKSEQEPSMVEQFRAKTEECFRKIDGYSAAEIEQMAKEYVLGVIEEEDIDVEVVDVVITGSRCRGLEKEGSDLDIVVEFKSESWSEDSLFNLLHEEDFSIGGVPVDFNPISEEEISGSLEEYLPRAEAYLAAKKDRMLIEENSKGAISRSDGVVVAGGYVVGGGRRGLTEELDTIVSREAEILQAHFSTDVTIRFNSDRKSGGAWLVDSSKDTLGSNCSIGLGARLYNSRVRSMTAQEAMDLPRNEFIQLINNPDSLCYETAINLKNTDHSVSADSPHILLDSEYRDFNTLEEAVEYLFSHVRGLKDGIQKNSLDKVIANASERATQVSCDSKNIDIER